MELKRNQKTGFSCTPPLRHISNLKLQNIIPILFAFCTLKERIKIMNSLDSFVAASAKAPLSPPESTSAAAAAPASLSPQKEGGGLRKSSGSSGPSGSSSSDLLTAVGAQQQGRPRLQRFLNSSMPAVPTSRTAFFTSPRGINPADESDDVRPHFSSSFYNAHSLNSRFPSNYRKCRKFPIEIFFCCFTGDA